MLTHTGMHCNCPAKVLKHILISTGTVSTSRPVQGLMTEDFAQQLAPVAELSLFLDDISASVCSPWHIYMTYDYLVLFFFFTNLEFKEKRLLRTESSNTVNACTVELWLFLVKCLNRSRSISLELQDT